MKSNNNPVLIAFSVFRNNMQSKKTCVSFSQLSLGERMLKQRKIDFRTQKWYPFWGVTLICGFIWVSWEKLRGWEAEKGCGVYKNKNYDLASCKMQNQNFSKCTDI